MQNNSFRRLFLYFFLIAGFVSESTTTFASLSPSESEIFERLKQSPQAYRDVIDKRIPLSDYLTSSTFAKEWYDTVMVVFDTSGSMRDSSTNLMAEEAVNTLYRVCFEFCDYRRLVILDGEGREMLDWIRVLDDPFEGKTKDLILSFTHYVRDSASVLPGLVIAAERAEEMESVSIVVVGDEIHTKRFKLLSKGINEILSKKLPKVFVVETQRKQAARMRIRSKSKSRYVDRYYWNYVNAMSLIAERSQGAYFIGIND